MIASTARVCDGLLFTICIRAALMWLEQHRDAVNAMNVFPVPDGDTGTNMWHTLESAAAAIQQLDTRHIGQVSDALARGALRGARGNSGTILSMLLRGFADGLNGVEIMDAQGFLRACQSAVNYAYETVRAVMPPVEGTILTVAYAAAEAIARHTDLDLYDLYASFVREARQALMTTPDLLPVLRQAGVVDSGGVWSGAYLGGGAALSRWRTVRASRSRRAACPYDPLRPRTIRRIRLRRAVLDDWGQSAAGANSA